jgi:hypothetical protein
MLYNRPPCSRYENAERSDDGDDRVIMVWGYAMALIGSSRLEQITKAVARLHDHKGQLCVALRTPLPEDCRWAFRRAWAEIGFEVEENVDFLDLHSKDWEGVWGSKRFESDWKA